MENLEDVYVIMWADYDHFTEIVGYKTQEEDAFQAMERLNKKSGTRHEDGHRPRLCYFFEKVVAL